jgi:hypothetical protein
MAQVGQGRKKTMNVVSVHELAAAKIAYSKDGYRSYFLVRLKERSNRRIALFAIFAACQLRKARNSNGWQQF